MYDRQTILRLAVGLMVSLILCVVALPSAGRVWLYSVPDVARPNPPQSLTSNAKKISVAKPRLLTTRSHVRLGDDKPDIASAAWISFEDYRQLMAPDDKRTVQPAVQRKVQPVLQAPHRLDATDPVPAARDPVRPSLPRSILEPPTVKFLEAISQASLAAVSGHRQSLSPSLEALPNLRLASVTAGPTRHQSSHPAGVASLSQDRPHKAASHVNTPPENPVAESTSASPSRPRPTASPHSDQEASPVTLALNIKQVRAGHVVTAQGVKIMTVAPNINTVTYLTAMRGGLHLPVVVVFNTLGHVTQAKLIQRTGYAEVDTPIRASLYRWTATGKTIAEIDGPFQIKIDIDIRIR